MEPSRGPPLSGVFSSIAVTGGARARAERADATLEASRSSGFSAYPASKDGPTVAAAAEMRSAALPVSSPLSSFAPPGREGVATGVLPRGASTLGSLTASAA